MELVLRRLQSQLSGLEPRAEPDSPPSGDSWQSVWTANPDLLVLHDRLLLYYRGAGTQPDREGRHDRIGVSRVTLIGPGNLKLEPLNGGQPIVGVGAEYEFDGKEALDPAAVVFGEQVFLYYSAIGNGPDSIGLATSPDGVSFIKVGKIMVGRAPDVILHDGKIAMVYQKLDASGNYQVYLAYSSDGLDFEDASTEPVFSPPEESWDSLSIATVRLSRQGEWFYAMYGGSSYLADEPDFFGLARSKDLVNWEFHPGNPVFGCGQKGAPDGGAIWFPAVYETDTHFVMLYEGSRGKYAWDLSSAICLASIPKPRG